MPQNSPSRHLDQFLVRFPDGMRDRIAAQAKANGRSMNSEIIQRLSATLETEPVDIQQAFETLTPEQRRNFLTLLDLVLKGTLNAED